MKKRVSFFAVSLALTALNLGVFPSMANAEAGTIYECYGTEHHCHPFECRINARADCWDICAAMHGEECQSVEQWGTPYCAENFGDCICFSEWTLTCTDGSKEYYNCTELTDECIVEYPKK